MSLGSSFPSIAAFSMSHLSLFAPFFYHIRPVLLVSTSRAFHVLYSPCHLSTVDWLIPACSQLLTPMFITHLLIFRQASLSFFLCYWSSSGGACCKQSQSYFIISNLSLWCQQESSQPVMTVKLVFLYPLWRKFSIIFISMSPFALSVYYCCVTYNGKGCSLPRPGHSKATG